MKQILVFDTETTGIPVWRERSDSVDQPHLVQLAALRADVDTREIVESMDVIIAPHDWVIPQVTTDIHGITNDHALEVGISETGAITQFVNMWRKCGGRIAHNTSFDNRIIRIAMKRWTVKSVSDEWNDGQYECTGQMARTVMGLKKMPKLVEAYQHFFHRDHKNKHTAMGDAIACMEIYFAIKDLEIR